VGSSSKNCPRRKIADIQEHVLEQKDNPMSNKPIPAIMPPERLGRPRRKLKELGPGDTAYLVYTDVVVDSDGATFVRRDAEIMNPGTNRVKVIMNSNDACTLVLPKNDPGLVFVPQPKSSGSFNNDNYFPVIQIEEGDERERETTTGGLMSEGNGNDLDDIEKLLKGCQHLEAKLADVMAKLEKRADITNQRRERPDEHQG
jgi:hypothetical protein